MFPQIISSFFSGNSKVESLLREHDWSASPLLETALWSKPLQYAVRFLLDSKNAIFIAWGPELRLLYNDAYAEVLGDRHPQAIGEPLQLVWPDVWPDIEPLVNRVIAGEACRFEDAYFVLQRDGKEVGSWFSFSYTPLRDLDGSIHGFYCILTETTDQVLMRQKRQSDTNRVYSLFERSPSFMAVLEGPQLKYTLANAAYLNFVGQRDLIGRSISEVFPEIRDQGYLNLFAQVYGSGEPFIGKNLPVALDRKGDGALETRYVDFLLQPILDGTEKITGIFVEGYDVTEHVLAQENARHSEQIALSATQLQQEERSRLMALLEAAPVGIGFADPSGRLTMVNAENRRIWGNHPMSEEVEEYLEWKGWWADRSSRHGMPIKPAEWGLARALRGEDAISDVIEIEPFGMPGTRRTLLLRAAPVRNSHGEIISAVVAQTDITDRVRSELALRESEQRFRTITDAMPQMVWSTLANGYHDYYNRQWYEFTGAPLGTTDGAGWNDMFHPEDQKRAWAEWNSSLSTGDIYEIEYRLRHHSGTYRWVLGRAFPVRNEENKIVRWMGTCTDIHDQKLAQVALQEKEERFRALAENIPQLAWMADVNGVIFWYNNRWYDYTGTAVNVMDDFGCKNIYHPEYVDAVKKKYCEHIRAGKVWEDTFPLKRHDGTYRWFLSRAVPIYDANGAITRWLGTNTDVTEQRDAAESLRQMDRRKDEFLAMLAHELRNPLAPITTAANLLTVTQPDSNRLKQISSVIARQASHMTSLVDDLLDVSRVTRGLITLHNEEISVKTVLAEAIEQAKPLIDSRAHQLKAKIPEDEYFVLGDRKRLVQVISNLLNNAAKYTLPGGEIEISLVPSDRQIQISVKDNGIGMSADLLVHAFDLFAQGQRTPDRAQGGLGIGLALVRSLVQLHGGSIAAFSNGPGHGSELTVTLPRVKSKSEIRSMNLSVDTIERSTISLKILVVDDNEDAAQTLTMYLNVLGHDAYSEYRGGTALERIREINPDVCLLDIGLPDIDGKELAARIRKIHPFQRVQIAAVTGYGQSQERQATADAGFDAHFVKPLDTSELNAWLTDVASLLDLQKSTHRGR